MKPIPPLHPTTTPVARLSAATMAECRRVRAQRVLYASAEEMAEIVADARANGDATMSGDDLDARPLVEIDRWADGGHMHDAEGHEIASARNARR